MRIMIKKESGIRNFSVICKMSVAFAFVFMLIKFPQEVSQGVRDGLLICGQSVIPSLFPFTVLCTFLTVSGLCDTIGNRLSSVMNLLFRLPGSAAGAVVMGMIGGYPVGTRMTAELLRENSISQNDAERMCLFCVSAGPAFLIGTVGTAILGNESAGKILFFASCLSTLTVGILLRFTANGEKRECAIGIRKPFAESLCESVSSAGGSMISVSTWIIFFSCICMAAKEFPDSVRVPLVSLLEVTNGTKTAADEGLPLPVISAILGWSGLSVQCQVFSYIEKCSVKPSRFIVSRIVSGALSALYCKGLLYLFPIEKPVMLTGAGMNVHPFSVSAPVSAAMLLTAGVFIINTSGMTDDIHEKLTKKKT